MISDPLSVPTPGLDYGTKKLVAASGRSWWQLRYRDGRVLSEWETSKLRSFLPGPLIGGSTSRWEEVSKKGAIALRLVCPNGNAGVLESPYEHRFFQLKVGHFDLIAGSQKFCDAQIIGLVLDDDDRCVCWAWETRERRLVKFEDHFHAMVYRNIGTLSVANLGVRL